MRNAKEKRNSKTRVREGGSSGNELTGVRDSVRTRTLKSREGEEREREIALNGGNGDGDGNGAMLVY